MELNYDSVHELSRFLKEHGIGLKKRWGQNFLINRGAREKIVNALELEPGEFLWEIGPGLGAMTSMIHKMEDIKVLALEIDRGLIKCLNLLFPPCEKFSIIQGDVVKTWKTALETHGPPDKILGNLPYSSASAIIAGFIEGELPAKKMVYTVQKELAQRITAKRGNKNCSSFSLFCQYAYDIKMTGDLKSGSFFPAPDVVSSIIEMVPKSEILQPKDKKLFFRLIRTAFGSRRKTLRNNYIKSPLADEFGKETLLDALASQGLGDNTRGEEVETEVFVALADFLSFVKPGDEPE